MFEKVLELYHHDSLYSVIILFIEREKLENGNIKNKNNLFIEKYNNYINQRNDYNIAKSLQDNLNNRNRFYRNINNSILNNLNILYPIINRNTINPINNTTNPLNNTTNPLNNTTNPLNNTTNH